MAEVIVVPYRRNLGRASFSCGQPELDEFLQRYATQYEKRFVARTFVAIEDGATKVLGYYTLAAGSIEFGSMPLDDRSGLPRHAIPAILLARLAVDQSAQGKGLGRDLLRNALERVASIEKLAGVHSVRVDAIDERAAAFYVRNEFTPLTDSPLVHYMPMRKVLTLVGGEDD